MNRYCVSLADMLRCRERRADKQKALLQRYGASLVCFSMNIPGTVKNSPLIQFAFEEGVRRLLSRAKAIYAEADSLPTGPEGFFVFDLPPEELKKLTLEIEENDSLGRLFDMDVLRVSGEKLARPTQRSCLLCGAPSADCARSRAHGLEAIDKKVQFILAEAAAKYYAALACNALICEAFVSPKPGLVDAENNGAHKDMCLATLLKSAASLKSYFTEAFILGLNGGESRALIDELRRRGLAAEKEMLKATKGINTHKGALYSFALLLCAQGLCLMGGGDRLAVAAALASTDMPEQLKKAKEAPASNGERLYAEHGILGARGEAAAGFPHAKACARAIAGYSSFGLNNAAVLALCETMAVLDDTNLLHRGGREGLIFVKNEAKRISALPAEKRIDEMRKLDGLMISKNLSPGGAADMLSLALYLYMTDEKQEKNEAIKL